MIEDRLLWESGLEVCGFDELSLEPGGNEVGFISDSFSTSITMTIPNQRSC